MFCDNCNKNEATIHYTEIINNKLIELHLCTSCAQNKGLGSLSPHYSLANLISGLTEIDDHVVTSSKEIEKACKACNMTYNDFKRLGLLGCNECYETFSKQIEQLLRKIHGTVYHAGKMPSKISKAVATEKKIIELKEKLKKLIELEEYEEAAKIRDKIKEIEG
ncbi:MAG: UvrB/UvrC motif-containing protein [bacterium]|nr:UvrB/UvrC motif-containing protein [bacterium]